jgi:putative MATE family efflux protein
MMSDEEGRNDPLIGSVPVVFFRYAIPEIVGMLAISSAGLVDAIFLGQYEGAEALAAVNLAVPVWSLIFGLALMIAVGGSVVCGKYMGEQNDSAANEIFSKTVVVSLAMGLAFAVLLGFFLIEPLALVLGATDESLIGPLRIYLSVILWFTPFTMLEMVFFYFVRLDGQPVFASAALIIGAVANIILDWLLIVHLEMGILGAALATASGAVFVTLVLLPHFFSKRATLKFSGPFTGMRGLARAYLNGASEFANEASVGVTTFIFNWVMVTRMGVEGVAALTIVNYLLMAGLMIIYGLSDSLQPLVSRNFGARKSHRIVGFLRVSAMASAVVCLLMIGVMLLIPEQLAGIFVGASEGETTGIATVFLAYLWPIFLFNGPNILASAYLTSIQKPMQSAFIAFSRSFALPAAFLLLLPMWLGDAGIYLSLPLAEAFTFFVSVLFVIQYSPSKAVEELARESQTS